MFDWFCWHISISNDSSTAHVSAHVSDDVIIAVTRLDNRLETRKDARSVWMDGRKSFDEMRASFPRVVATVKMMQEHLFPGINERLQLMQENIDALQRLVDPEAPLSRKDARAYAQDTPAGNALRDEHAQSLSAGSTTVPTTGEPVDGQVRREVEAIETRIHNASHVTNDMSQHTIEQTCATLQTYPSTSV